MMKILLFLFLSFWTVTILCGQVRLNSTVQEIKKEFWEAKYNFQSDVTEDGVPFATISNSFVEAIYYFDKDGLCKLTILVPNNEGILNGMVERYNKNYVIVSNTEWKKYAKNGLCQIKLYFKEEGYYFAWSTED